MQRCSENEKCVQAGVHTGQYRNVLGGWERKRSGESGCVGAIVGKVVVGDGHAGSFVNGEV